MKLSQRLEAVAAMVSAGNVLADVGTDHGYIPIALVQRGQIPAAIAMDLREGPLARAKEHIASNGLSNLIKTRLSDGVEALAEGEADSIVIAGMGGELIIHILQDGESVCKAARELVLQPQSEYAGVRCFLRENGYRITDEDMVLEDGKFYVIMHVVPDVEGHMEASGEPETEAHMVTAGEWGRLCDIYGPFLLRKRHPVLKLFLEQQERQQEQILKELERQPQSEKIMNRAKEVRRETAYNKKAQSIYSCPWDSQ